MKSRHLTFLFMLCLLSTAISCSKKESTTAVGGSGLSSEAQAMAAASSNFEAAGDNENGALNGISSGPSLMAITVDFDYESGCKTSGGLDETEYDNTAATWPIYNLYCLLRKRPDGPDTARGAIDRASGWLCAMGQLTYDGVARSKTITIGTDCFSSTFVDMVADELGTTSLAATITAYDDATGVAAGFDKYITFVSDVVTYKIAVKDSATEKAIAVLDVNADPNLSDAFAVYMNKTTGVMKVEGRFPEHTRHFRFHMVGELDANFEITNVEDLHFINSEQNSYQSMSGTPAAGRKVKYDNYAGNMGHAGNNQCYGEDGATCVGNSGLVLNSAFAFTTKAAGWFENNAYLGSTADLVDNVSDDIW